MFHWYFPVGVVRPNGEPDAENSTLDAPGGRTPKRPTDQSKRPSAASSLRRVSAPGPSPGPKQERHAPAGLLACGSKRDARPSQAKRPVTAMWKPHHDAHRARRSQLQGQPRIWGEPRHRIPVEPSRAPARYQGRPKAAHAGALHRLFAIAQALSQVRLERVGFKVKPTRHPSPEFAEGECPGPIITNAWVHGPQARRCAASRGWVRRRPRVRLKPTRASRPP
jgi:hypothetical protein